MFFVSFWMATNSAGASSRRQLLHLQQSPTASNGQFQLPSEDIASTLAAAFAAVIRLLVEVSVMDFPSIRVRKAVPEQEGGADRMVRRRPFVRPFTNESGQSFGLPVM